MDAQKRKAIEAAGGRVTTVAEFLGLHQADAELIELRLDLAERLKAERLKVGMSQGELAKLLKTTQAGVARMEASSGVSIEALLRALRVLGQRTVLTFKRAS